MTSLSVNSVTRINTKRHLSGYLFIRFLRNKNTLFGEWDHFLLDDEKVRTGFAGLILYPQQLGNESLFVLGFI